jgi:DNA-binding NtrC family response regulator
VDADRDSDTGTVTLNDSPSGSRRPVLILVGAAGALSRQTSDWLVPVDSTLLIGREAAKVAGTEPRWALEDRLVSGRHARLERGPQGVQIMDLGSKNHTVLNGHRVEGAARLTDGDLLFLGAHALVFRMVSEAQANALRADHESPFGPTATRSPHVAALSDRLRRLAPSNGEILLVGETGAGKEVFANAIHRTSARRGPFLAVNCAALPRDLIESELFGYARGAHSQATRAKPGLIEQANEGTLFLDEIGEMPADAQAKLLRFLQTMTFTPLGAVHPVKVDVRVIAATNRRPSPGDGSPLRPDLAARLGGQPVTLPPLRDRIEDLGLLISHFIGPSPLRPLQVAAFRDLCLYRWPGNIRQLEKIITEAALLAAGQGEIGREHLPEGLASRPAVSFAAAAGEPPPRVRRPAPSPEVLERLLAKHRGNVAEVARELDRKWAVIWRCIVRAGIDVSRFRTDGKTAEMSHPSTAEEDVRLPTSRNGPSM